MMFRYPVVLVDAKKGSVGNYRNGDSAYFRRYSALLFLKFLISSFFAFQRRPESHSQ